MKLIVGLGNPGKEHVQTRHNIGWMIIDEFLQKYANAFSAFSENKKFNAEICNGALGTEKIILAKPLTFMNNSGMAVRAIMNFYKIQPQNLLVIHDDIDLALGKIKLETKRSSAGHNGVQSIIEMLGTQDFARARVGIGREKRGDAARFVLCKFGFFEKAKLKNIITKVLADINKFISNSQE